MNWGLPPDWSAEGHHIDQLISIIHWAILALGLFWLVFFLWSLWRFRAGGSTATRQASRSRWPLWMAFALLVFEVGLMVVIEIPLWAERSNLPAEEDSFVLRVIGEQFAWNFHYPGEDRAFGSTHPDLIDEFNPIGLDMNDPAAGDDLVTINQMHLPSGQRILLWLGAKDVIHNFYLPYFRVKQDAIPGRFIPIWFTPRREGVSEIGCAQLCGLGHFRMRGQVQVEPLDEFEAWYREELAYM